MVTTDFRSRLSALVAKQPELAAAPNYNVQVLRRAEAGTPEFHLKCTHVFFIQDGEATFVSGRAFEGRKEISSGEFRGTSIVNGTTTQLRKGDVVVPRGDAALVARGAAANHLLQRQYRSALSGFEQRQIVSGSIYCLERQGAH